MGVFFARNSLFTAHPSLGLSPGGLDLLHALSQQEQSELAIANR
jgi:hypothetical protein